MRRAGESWAKFLAVLPRLAEAAIPCPLMSQDRVKALAALPLFQRLSRKDLDVIARSMDEINLPAGHTLITQGRSNHAFYVLQSGEVDVSVAGKHRRRLGKGDFFGEISMDSRGDATATVVTASPVHAYVMSHSQFSALAANSEVLLKLRSAIAEHLLEDRQSR